MLLVPPTGPEQDTQDGTLACDLQVFPGKGKIGDGGGDASMTILLVFLCDVDVMLLEGNQLELLVGNKSYLGMRGTRPAATPT